LSQENGMDRFRVLLVEDNPADANLIDEMLHGSNGTTFALDHTSRLSESLDRLSKKTFDLVLLDLSLPDSRGYATFEAVHTHASHIPTIILTGMDDKDLALRAIRHGAQDYLLKDQVNGVILKQTLHHAIERKKLERSLNRRNAKLRALQEVGVEITSELELDNLLYAITSRAVKLTGCSAGILGLYHADQDMVEFATSVGVESIPNPPVVHRGEGLAGTILASREPLLVDDYAAWAGSIPAWRAAVGCRAILGMPIVWGEQFLGVLHIIAPSSDVFDAQIVELLGFFCNQAAIAIRNAQLHQTLENRAEWLEKEVEARTEEIQAQRTQVEAILRSIQDGIVVMDAQGTILHTNEVVSSWFNHTLTLEDVQKLKDRVRSLAKDPQLDSEVLLDLHNLSLELVKTSIPDVEAGAGSTLVVIHDITHLRALDRLRSRFVSNISHELRTPLSSIRLCLRLIRQQPDRLDHYLDVMEREVGYEIQLIEQVMKLSRLDAGGFDVDRERKSLDGMVKIALANHQFMADTEGIALHYEPADLDLVVLADQRYILQALNNLLRNAIKFNESGGNVTIRIRQRATQERRWATVVVEDTGMGIPDDELPHIFDRFFRGARPSADRISGYGLGLAMAKEIVELHGGKITVTSEVDRGSAFTVWLPLIEATE
jgi:two-component system, OmpR family, phosphate regulon sensor histidine kinase PhoR